MTTIKKCWRRLLFGRAGRWVALTLLSSGCSIPVGPAGKSLTLGYSRTSTSARQYQTAVPGLDIRIKSEHDGINIGWSSLTVAEPEPEPAGQNGPPQKAPSWRYLPPLGLRRSDLESDKRWGWFLWSRAALSPAECRFVAAGYAGIVLSMNPHAKSLDVGIGRQTWLLIPSNSNGNWTLSFRSGVGGTTQLQPEPQSK